ncbi:MAG TPA: AAA family ATPase [bacterium]|nr:AAA family ATPase [bacterium]HPL72904.1 AAA family ATPase [Candidatus Pacearchaeota archaeon]HQK41855.1 AAA family ATPase [bacterium]
MSYNSSYPFKHLSVRVPWHDNQWDGSICKNPKDNSSCLVLKEIYEKKDENKETFLAGKSIKDLEENEFPACIRDRGFFMSDFSIVRNIEHPYSEKSPKSHGHLKPTRVTYPPYCFGAIPYKWMLKENSQKYKELYDLNYDEQREPILDWGKRDTTWVQEGQNQNELLNCFFSHFKEEESLVFCYAKRVPFIEEGRKVLIGVGKIHNIIPSDYYDGSNSKFSASYWEYRVQHTIRKDKKNGFLLPYYEAIEYQKQNPNFNPADIAVMIPKDKQLEFSYVAEHVSNDTAIKLLLECEISLEKAEKLCIGSNNQNAIQWIHNEIAKLEKLRSDYPGMGSALCAFGISKGYFVAAEIINKLKNKDENPWEYFEKALENTTQYLSTRVASLIPNTCKNLYKHLASKDDSERLNFLYLLSRFDLSIEQAELLYNKEEREKKCIRTTENEYLENPYKIYEDLLNTIYPISFETIDLGMYLQNPGKNLLPNGLNYKDDPYHNYRIRALTIQQLEVASDLGHTLLPRSEIIIKIREYPLQPKCNLTEDYYMLSENAFNDAIVKEKINDGEVAYQLSRYSVTKTTISKKVYDRINGQRLSIETDWMKYIEKHFNQNINTETDEQEKRARIEKSAALTELSQSRFSVLIGPAGTGKTTLLSILVSHPEIEDRGVLFLAPTGKSRVRIEEIVKNKNVTTKTLAQFLFTYGRYRFDTQEYILDGGTCDLYETVIIDESSMLTEEMLATTFLCLRGVKRFILVGDHRQLPPIGAGRPFVDIINYIRPEEIERKFPRIGKGYAELTVKCRQGGSKREDLQLAEWFSGEQLEPAADDIFSKLITNKKEDFIRLEKWETEAEFEDLFEKILVEELGLTSINDIDGFNDIMGANVTNNGTYFNFREAVNKIDNWQILTPVREKIFGVKAINRKIHKLFRTKLVEYARSKNGKIPKPLGIEEIVYGDKVINLENSVWKENLVFPKENCLKYVANGEIGIVIGQFKTNKMNFKGHPGNTEIEFSSQKGYKYIYRSFNFKDEDNPPLELAYALTVHKAQGSEFKRVFLILPNPCFLLSRELLYTALTRQVDKIIILYQGNIFDIKNYSTPKKSETLKRITNLFKDPDMVEVDGQYLEKNLIHQASDKTLVRSKSELIIYQRLLDKGFSPMYEKPLKINGVEKLPDFTIINDETGFTYFWEHCGLLYDVEYKKRWDEKFQWYLDNDILPFEQGGGKNGILIVTEEKPQKTDDGTIKGAFSIKEIDNIINNVLSNIKK